MLWGVSTILTVISLGCRFDTVALGAAYKEPQSEDLDKDKNSDADYDNCYDCADVS